MYTKEQEEMALREYERQGSVAAVIQRLGYPSESTLYRWYERKKAGLENRHGQIAETTTTTGHHCNTPGHPRHPSAELKYEVLHRCFELGEDVEYVSREIGYSRMSIYTWRRKYLKWDAIDFDLNTITIRHTVTSCDLDGKRILVAADTTKTKSSMRTLPLVPFMRERLLALREEQKENRRLCGRSYIKDYVDYVCVNEIGDLIKPHYVTESFPKLLKANGLRPVRYHDLRHSCASLLLANGVPMKQIQEWLGHSDFTITANIYAHLDYSSKLSSAQAMERGLPLPENDFGSRWVTVGYYDNAKEIAHFLPRALDRKAEMQEAFQN